MRVLGTQRGTTLLEAMIAMVVLLIGAIGVIGAHRQGLRLASDARRITRASAIAQDLVDQIALWPWGDARLAQNHYNLANYQNIGDPNFAFETTANLSGICDHLDTPLPSGDLTLGGNVWNGIPTSVIQSYGQGFQRCWNVAYVDDIDNNGIWDAVRIAVIVRWGDSVTGYRRIVSLTTKANPNP